ncbi:MAG: transcriptional regulator [Rhodobacteraceae bacterium]|nr:MAG: transcriptional regulator [Paracoccaceae bacterium]
MQAQTPAKPTTVRALMRGLDILRYINTNGAAKPAQIAQETGIPRPTVYRLLETLEEAGYVYYSASSNRVRVTRLAASLGDGFAMTSRMCQIAAPLFAQYSPKIIWPLDVTVYDNAAMVIQETTHGRSPLSIDHGMVGYRLPMLRTSAGRCYLGLCPAEERDLILEHLRRLNDPLDMPFFAPEFLDRMLQEVQERGIAMRDAAEFRPKTSSIALPIWSSGLLVGCLSMIWVKQAMPLSEVLHSYEAPLREITQRISQELDAD